MALLVSQRRTLLHHAMAPVIEAPTVPLANIRQQNQVVEVAVRVKKTRRPPAVL